MAVDPSWESNALASKVKREEKPGEAPAGRAADGVWERPNSSCASLSKQQRNVLPFLQCVLVQPNLGEEMMEKTRAAQREARGPAGDVDGHPVGPFWETQQFKFII